MGIQGLLPLLKSIMAPIHIKELEGCIVAVDTYSWLHKGALSCSRELCKGLPTTRFVSLPLLSYLDEYRFRSIGFVFPKFKELGFFGLMCLVSCR